MPHSQLRWRRCRSKLRSAKARHWRSARSGARVMVRDLASSSTWRRRRELMSPYSPRDRRRIGRCRCRWRSRARQRACGVSPSSSTALRPAPNTTALPSRSPRSQENTRSRSPPISTNSPGRLTWAPACPCAGTSERAGEAASIVNERMRVMPIKVGDNLPEANFRVWAADGPAGKSTDDIFKGKKVALFAVPGAFTGTCHKMHVPSILQSADAIKAKGVDTIAVTSVNDVFVMDAWKKGTAADNIEFLADGNGEFAKAVDLSFDGSGNGLGIRSKRYAMLVEDGVVKKLNMQEAPGTVRVSGGDALLKQLGSLA